MRILTCAAAALAAALLVVAPGTAGKGGPTPDPLLGWDGVVSRERRASATSRFPARHDDGRRRARQRRARAPLRHGSRARSGSRRSRGTGRRTASRPTARGSCWPRSRAARSASRRPSSSCGRTRLSVQRRIELSGHWVFDAISPDGSTIYAVQYADLSHYSVRAIDTVSGRVPRRRSSTSASPTRRCAARR